MRVTECIFRSGETLPRETILCGNGRGSLSGYFQIGSKLKAGSGSGRDNSKYRFNTTGRILKGLEVRAGSNIDAIALIVSKKVKAVNRVNFKFNYGIYHEPKIMLVWHTTNDKHQKYYYECGS